MQLLTEDRGEVLIVRVLDRRIDSAVVIRFKDRMREIVDHRAQRVILDLGRVDFLDSSGLGAVVAVMKMLGPDRRLELMGLTPAVEKVFRLTRMDGVFTIHPSAPDGLCHAV